MGLFESAVDDNSCFSGHPQSSLVQLHQKISRLWEFRENARSVGDTMETSLIGSSMLHQLS